MGDMISARKVISLKTPDNAYYQVPAHVADNKITDNTTLPSPTQDVGERRAAAPPANRGARLS